VERRAIRNQPNPARTESTTAESRPEAGPRVSVLMPIHNGARYLNEAIDSLFEQTMFDWELVAILDSCEDESEAVLARYSDHRIRFQPLEGRTGVAAALNFGLSLCRCEYVARLDADDVCLPDRLETQAAALDARPNIGVIGSSAILIDSESRVIGARPVSTGTYNVAQGMLWRAKVIHPSVMFRRSLVLAVGGYNERLKRLEDYELWLRMLTTCWIDNISDPLIAKREHAKQHAIGSTLVGEPLRDIAAARRVACAFLEKSRTQTMIRDVAWLAGQLRREVRIRLRLRGFGAGPHLT
jgi:glycosyltransferase involved in cell wall biosynthesis